jgi:hypothetical protein
MTTSRTGRVVTAVAITLAARRAATAGLRLLGHLERAAQRGVVAAVFGHLQAEEATGARFSEPLAPWPGAERAADALLALLAPYNVDVQWTALGEMITMIHGADLAPTAASPPPTAASPPPTAASPGPTELILRVLGEATARMHARQIIVRVQAIDPHITAGHLNTILYRLHLAGRVERSGSRCAYRYRVARAHPPARLHRTGHARRRDDGAPEVPVLH